MPDIYQGQELWDFSLVDPDNRRPVDFARRREMLVQLRADIETGDSSLLALARRLAQDPRDELLKLFVTSQVLHFRQQYSDLFQFGTYRPLEVRGPKSRHACAFAWEYSSPGESATQIAVVIAPRLIAQLTPPAEGSQQAPLPLGPAVWEDTHVVTENLTTSPLRNVFTGLACTPQDSRLAMADALSDFPVALLANAAS